MFGFIPISEQAVKERALYKIELFGDADKADLR